MNNLPGNATQDMIDAQCAPIGEGYDACYDCGNDCLITEMHPWQKYDPFHRMVMEVLLCERCVPRCLWLHDENGHVKLDLKPCGRIQSPNAQGPWCAEHEKEAEALDNQESEK